MLVHVPGVRTALVLALLLGPGVADSVADGWNLEHPVTFSSTDFSVEKTDDGLAVRSPSGLSLGRPASPDFPLEPVRLVLPAGMRIQDVTLRDAEWAPLAAGRLRDQGEILASAGGATNVTTDRFGLGEGRVPARTVRAGATGSLEGYGVGTVEILPVRESADGGVEYLRSARLEIALEVDPRERLQRRIEWPGRREACRLRVAAMVDNPADVEAWAPDQGRSPSLLSEPRPGTPAARSVRPEPRPIDFMIITTAGLAPSYEVLAARRESEGLSTVVVTLDEVFATATPGADQQETIRNYVRDAWSTWGLQYLMIGCDAELIPPRYARSTYYPTGGYTDIPTDLYYAALDGTWNADGNGVPGEPGDAVDMLAEISIGRAPLDTPAEVDAWVGKILAYEEPSDITFAGRALFLSEVLFPDDWTETSGQPVAVDGATYSEDLIFDQIIGGGNPMQSWRMYQNYTEYAGAIPETKAAALDSLDTGRFGLVNHIGHGFYYNASVGDANIFADDAGALTNPNPFFIHALNCSSGAFDVDSLLERFLQNTHGGAVASAGSSRAAFPYWSAFYQTDFFHEIFVERNVRLGDAQRVARANYVGLTDNEGGHRWTHFAYSLFGDPTMRLWVSGPRASVVTHASSVDLGAGTLEVDVSVSGGAAGAVVAVSDGSGRVSRAAVDGAGHASVDLSGFDGKVGSLDVVMSGGNLLRYASTVDVVATGSGHLRAEAMALDDDAVLPSDGDGDGTVDSGETVEWSFRFENAGGGATVSGATATLVAVDAPGATILVDTAPVGSVANGAFVDAPPFVVQLDPGIADGSLLEFEVQTTDGVETWTDPVELEVRSPILRVVRLSVDDSASGNGDQVADAGEVFDLVVEVINRGEADLRGLSATLVSADPAVSIIDGQAAWPDLAPDTPATSSDPLTMSESDVAIEHLSQLVFTDDQGHQWTHDFELRPPAAPGDPTPDTSLGPDLIALRMPTAAEPHFAGYRAYGRMVDGGGAFAPLGDEPSELTGLLVHSGLPELTRFEYYVTLVDSSRVESAPTAVVTASTAPGELSPGFPIPIGRELGGPLAVGDLRGDMTNVVAFGADWIYAIDADGQELVDGDNDAQTLGPLGGDPANLRFSPSGVTVADLDADGADEVIGSNWNSNQIWVLNGDGSPVPGWPQPMNGSSWATPSVGDLDDDGDLEIVVNNTAGRTYVWHHDGSDFFDADGIPSTVGVFHQRPGESFNRSTPALYDVDGDGTLEILFGTHYRDGVTDNMVHALRNDGTDAPGWPKNMGPSGYTVGHMTVGDLDQDGTVELILLTENNLLNLWQPDGSTYGTAPYNVFSNAAARDSRAPAASLADFDFDGELEMVVVSIIDRDECEIMIMEADGTVWPDWPRTLPGLSESSPVLGDIDGDSRIDIVFGIGGGKDGAPNVLYAMAPDATDVAGFPITLSGAIRAVPVISDFDQDGDVDVVYAGFDRLVHVWDMPFEYREALVPWPTFQADMHRTGVYAAPVATSVLSASIDLAATPQGVRIQAAFDGALPRDLRFRLDRRSADAEEWAEVGADLAAEGGLLVFVDRQARAGESYEYRLIVPDRGVEFRSALIAVPALRAAIRSAQPNPFNPRTTIRFDVPGTAGAQVPTRLEVYDLKGRRVRRIHVGPLAPGSHAMDWDGVDDQGRSVSSGVYFAVLRCAGEQESLKMSLVK